MSNLDLRDRCEAYLLGLLDGDEHAAIAAQVAAGDPETLAALQDANGFVADISLAVPLAEPPALLRSRLLNGIAGAAPRPSVARYLPWAIAAAMAALAFLQLSNARRASVELAAAQDNAARLQSEVLRQKEVLAVVLARNTRLVPISTAAKEPVFRAFWNGSSGLVLSGSNVPPPAPGRSLQLWIVPKSGNPVSAGVFTPDADGNVTLLATSSAAPADSAALAISDEPAGGSPQPTTTPAYVGAIGD